MIYLLTGNPGAGKSTVAVQHAIYRYAVRGRRVVANFPIDFAPVAQDHRRPLSKASVYVIPDRPSRADLDAIGFGGETEETAGCLIIDEAGTWLNARTWNAGSAEGPDDDADAGEAPVKRVRSLAEKKPSERQLLLDWLTQSRKRYWDIFLVAQAPSMLDKQCRDAVCEMVATIRRTDRMRILGARMPRMHIAIVHYGLEVNAPRLERWVYSGKEAQRCFMSYRLFAMPDVMPTPREVKAGQLSGHYCVLPATHTKFRTDAPKTQLAALGRQLAELVRLPPAPPRVQLPPKPKLPVVELIAKLPPDLRIKHWRRFDELGGLSMPSVPSMPVRSELRA